MRVSDCSYAKILMDEVTGDASITRCHGYVYACMHVCMSACMGVCMYGCMCIYGMSCKDSDGLSHWGCEHCEMPMVCLCMCACVYVYMCTCMCVSYAKIFMDEVNGDACVFVCMYDMQGFL